MLASHCTLLSMSNHLVSPAPGSIDTGSCESARELAGSSMLRASDTTSSREEQSRNDIELQAIRRRSPERRAKAVSGYRSAKGVSQQVARSDKGCGVRSRVEHSPIVLGGIARERASRVERGVTEYSLLPNKPEVCVSQWFGVWLLCVLRYVLYRLDPVSSTTWPTCRAV